MTKHKHLWPGVAYGLVMLAIFNISPVYATDLDQVLQNDIFPDRLLTPESGTVTYLNKTENQPQSTLNPIPGIGDDGSPVEYVSLQNETYEMLVFEGEKVEVLVPVDWRSVLGMTEDQLERLISLLDNTCRHMEEILDWAPVYPHKIRYAYIEHGFQGKSKSAAAVYTIKGAIEYYFGYQDGEYYRQQLHYLNANLIDWISVHELAHIYEPFLLYIASGSDIWHYWTNFFVPFTYYYSGMPTAVYDLDIETLNDYRYSIDSMRQSTDSFYSYMAWEGTNWADCFDLSNENAQCSVQLGDSSKQSIWASIYINFARLHGPKAILDSFVWVWDEIGRLDAQGLNVGDLRPVDREDLRMKSLAHSLKTNVACYADAWKWTLSDEARSELTMAYGEVSPHCLDGDADGFSLLDGDCSEDDSAIYPGTDEKPNGIDDNCNGWIDETLFKETTDIEVEEPVLLALGEVAEADFDVAEDVSDIFRYSVDAGQKLELTVCASPGLQVGGDTLDSNMKQFSTPPTFNVMMGTCKRVRIRAPDDGKFQVRLVPMAFNFNPAGPQEQTSGKYSLHVDEIPGQFSRPWIDLETKVTDVNPLNNRNNLSVKLKNIESQGLQRGADSVRVILERFGPVGEEFPISGQTMVLDDTFRDVSTGLVAGRRYGIGVQYLAEGLPVSDFSTSFQLEFGPVSDTSEVSGWHSGAWFDPSHDGEGLVIDILDNQRAAVFWYTYDTDRKQAWFLGLGKVDGHLIEIDEWLAFEGGDFGQTEPSKISQKSVGQAHIKLLDCDRAMMNYSVHEQRGAQMLQRLTGPVAIPCDGEPLNESFKDYGGSWYDPIHDGEGINLQLIGDGRAVIFWFTYRQGGLGMLWLLGHGDVTGNTIQFPQILTTSGAEFGVGFKPAEVTEHSVGSIELNMSCDEGVMKFQSSEDEDLVRNLHLTRLTRILDAHCNDD